MDIEGANNGEKKPRVPNITIEITKDCWLILEWDGMFARNVISSKKFKAEEQSCFAAKENITQIHRLQGRTKCICEIY